MAFRGFDFSIFTGSMMIIFSLLLNIMKTLSLIPAILIYMILIIVWFLQSLMYSIAYVIRLILPATALFTPLLIFFRTLHWIFDLSSRGLDLLVTYLQKGGNTLVKFIYSVNTKDLIVDLEAAESARLRQGQAAEDASAAYREREAIRNLEKAESSQRAAEAARETVQERTAAQRQQVSATRQEELLRKI